MIVDEAEEDLEMEEDPFHEEELPAVLEEEECFKKSVLRESKISIALSNASELPLEIGSTQRLEKTGTIAEANESDGVDPGDDPDNTSREVSFLIEDEENGRSDSIATEMTEMTV